MNCCTGLSGSWEHLLNLVCSIITFFSQTKETVKLCQNAVIFLSVSPILVDAKMSLASSLRQYNRVLTRRSSDSHDSPDVDGTAGNDISTSANGLGCRKELVPDHLTKSCS